MRIGARILERIAAWKWRILIAYLLLLGASYLVRWQHATETHWSDGLTPRPVEMVCQRIRCGKKFHLVQTGGHEDDRA
jgi:hypothetical protein